MSINSQAIADLEKQGLLNDDVPFDSFNGKEISVNTNPVPGTTATPLTDALKEKLLSPQTAYKTITAGVESVTDMEGVQSSIAKNNTISFANAEEVSMTFESFKKHISLAEFSRAPSQINLAFTNRFMKDQIKLKKENVNTAMENFLSGPLADIEETFYQYKEFYGKSLIEELREFQPKCSDWLLNKKSIPNQIFQSGVGFVNLATISLEEFPSSFIGPGDTKLFMSAIENLKYNSKDGFDVNCIKDVIEGRGVIPGTETDNKFISSAALASLDFIKFFSKPFLVESLLTIEKTAEEAVNKLNSIKEEAKISPAEFQQVRDFVVSNGKDIEDANDKINYYLEVTEMLRVSFPNVSVILDYFSI